MTGAPAAFDLLGELPAGTTVLEASAGTGKTFTIAGLVARYIAEGVAVMDELLVVTFGRAATRELRERVRERLVSARDGLADPAAARAGDDQVLALLADADDEETARRRRLLDEAVSSFDAATVTTTHGFCQQILAGLGTAGDHDAGSVLVESAADLIGEVAGDLYLQRWARPGAPPPGLTWPEALELARRAMDDPATPMVPADADPEGLAALRHGYATAVRGEVERRKRALRILGYDDLLLRLAAALHDPDRGAAAVGRLRSRYRIVLVDEFQDTDPVQWDILRTAFVGYATVVLIGDPKQAIYAFRGADVHAYLQAADAAGPDRVRTLPRNWRSDEPLLRGMAAVLRGAALGDARIRVTDVEAHHPGPLLVRQEPLRPARLRVLPREGFQLNGNGTVKADEAKPAVVADVTAEIVSLLSGGTRLRPRGGGPERPVCPADVAVLVRDNWQAEQVRASLTAAAVPAVVTGTSSVFASAAAREWVVLLEAMEQPHRTGRVRRFALTCFAGWTAERLDDGGDAAADAVGLRLRDWTRVLEQRGVAALFETVSSDERLAERVLAGDGGERLLADLRHVAEALHESALQGRLGLSALLGWLRRRVEHPAVDGGGQERSRRLESDADAVQVVTVHTSKGLEFPVVHVPFAWNCSAFETSAPTFHDDQGLRARDVGGKTGPGWRDHLAAHKAEDAAEELRLLYVALTRAQGELVMWWVPGWNTPAAPLHRLLFADDPAVDVPAKKDVPSGDEAALAVLRSRADASGGGLAVEIVAPAGPALWAPPEQPARDLRVARFDRAVDTSWRRTSYSALTAGSHDAGPAVASEPEDRQKDDEADGTDAAALAPDGLDALRTIASPMSELPAGPEFGTLVHSVLEQLVMPAADLPAALREAARHQIRRNGSALSPDVLADGLLPALGTPLGPLCDGMRLTDFPDGDRLTELDFELPLAGGDRFVKGTPEVVLGDVAPLFARHVPEGSLLWRYGGLLADAKHAASPLRGYLTGSVDAVLRVPGPRYVVVDYKTNRLAPRGETVTAWHYRPAALEQAMLDEHYPLQALLYSVALHRFLRWRQPQYDPDVHLGGALYLFLRGMTGPAAGGPDGSAPSGVFSWRPPAPLIEDLSELLAGRPR